MSDESNLHSNFAHLHLHTEYSELDGGCKVAKIAAKAKSLGMRHVGISDHGNVNGLPAFAQAMKAEGIKSVLGCEIYLTPDRTIKKREAKTWHLGLIAANKEGYKNLTQITTRAWLEGYFNRRGRADWDVLADHAGGIIALTGCMAAPVMNALFEGSYTDAREHTRRLIEIFGKDNVYGEVQNVGIVEPIPADSELALKLGKAELSQMDANLQLAEICKEFGIPLIATGDVHYLEESDALPHDAMVCLGTGQIQARPETRKFSLLPKKYYFRTEEEMRENLPGFAEAIEETVRLAERVEDDIIEFDQDLLPAFPIPEGFPSSKEYLRHLCEEGMIQRYGPREEQTEEQRERLDFELGVIDSMGFNDYFLITGDFFRESFERNIPTGPGRGSAAGSIVAYLLGITQLDPLKYGLLFERFLNPGRKSMPDIDCDFSRYRREEIIEYVREKYNTLAGTDTAVSQILTHGTIGAKAGLRDAARVLDKPIALGDRLSKMVPDKPGTSLRDAYEQVPEFKSAFKADPDAREVIKLAGWLEGFVRQSGIHAAGVVILDRPLESVVPLQRRGDKEPLTTAYEQKWVEKIGLLKMDFLGLKTLDLIWRAREIIEHTTGTDLGNPYTDIPLDDAKTYEMLSRGEAIGVFQFESSGMRESLRLIQPTEFRDLIALVALYRPGPLEYIPVYAARKQGKEEVTYPDPRLEPILHETYSIVVYQEQSMQIARELAGFSPAEADDLRKAIGKKMRDLMDSMRPKFIEGCVKNSVPKNVAEQLWADNEKAADYSFNKCARGRTTYVHLPDGTRMTLAEAYNKQPPEIMSMWPDGTIRPHRVKKYVKTGRKPVFKVRTKGKRMIEATAEHRLMTTEGWKRIDELAPGMELIVRERPCNDAQRAARRRNGKAIHQHPDRDRWYAGASERMKAYQATRSEEEKAAHVRRMHEMYPDLTRAGVAAMHDRVKWLWANDPEWRKSQMEKSLANVRDAYDTGPGWGHCSIASNGMWCASSHERAMCEWLIDQGIDFEMHKVLGTGRICDFYFDGTYWEMDGLDRVSEYFAEKYGELPYVVVTPEDFREVVTTHMQLEHAENGDEIVSIEPSGVHMTYDVEMEPDGPLNYMANNIVSHNSHAACYGFLAYVTAYLKANYPAAYMAALMSINADTKDKVPVFINEAKRMGLTVRPPDVNRSLRDFAVMPSEVEGHEDEFEILFGLSAVKGVGDAVISDIRTEREAHGPFRSVTDLIRRMPQLNKGVIERLVKSGALDGTGQTRKGMFDAIEALIDVNRKEARAKEKVFVTDVLGVYGTASALDPDAAPADAPTPAAPPAAAADEGQVLFDFGAPAEEEAKPATKGAKPKAAKLPTEEKKAVEAIAKAANTARAVPSVADARAAALKAITSEEQRKLRAEARKQTEIDSDQLEAGVQRTLAEGEDRRKAEAKAITKKALACVEEVMGRVPDEQEEVLAALAEQAPTVPIGTGEWEEMEKLNLEREILGLYVSAHPLTRHEQQWRRYASHGIGVLSGKDLDTSVRVVGAITGTRLLRTKKGEQFGIEVMLDDPTGSRPVTFFIPRGGEAARPPRPGGDRPGFKTRVTIDSEQQALLQDGTIVVINAKVVEDAFRGAQKQEEDADPDAIQDESQIEVKLEGLAVYTWKPEMVDTSPVSPFEIHIPPAARTKKVLSHLEEMLEASPGPSPVLICIDDKRIKLKRDGGQGTQYRVSITPTLQKEVSRLLGTGS